VTKQKKEFFSPTLTRITPSTQDY